MERDGWNGLTKAAAPPNGEDAKHAAQRNYSRLQCGTVSPKMY